jgi:DNA repair exonuclease SbcCD ATPase subunit
MERKEPTLSGIAPDKDEIEARQEIKPSGPERPKAARPTGPRPPASKPPAASGSNVLVFVALLLAVIGLGASGFLGWQFYEAEQELAHSEARIADLERRLDVTYDESVDSIEAVQAKLQWADSEIRKLWGVSHDTNRRNIANNRDQIAALKTELDSVRGDASASRSAIDGFNDSLAEVKATVTSLQSGLGSVEEQQQRLQNLQEQLHQFSDRIAQLSNLTSRVEANEEAIAAIDSYRRSINRDLMALKDQLAQQ